MHLFCIVENRSQISKTTTMKHLGNGLTADELIDASDTTMGVKNSDATVASASDLQQLFCELFTQWSFVGRFADVDSNQQVQLPSLTRSGGVVVKSSVLTLPGRLAADTTRSADKLGEDLTPGDRRRRQPTLDQFLDILGDITVGFSMGLLDKVADSIKQKFGSSSLQRALGLLHDVQPAPDPDSPNPDQYGE